MEENFVLVLFLIVPLPLCLATQAFIRVANKTPQKHTLAALILGNVLVLLSLLSAVVLCGEVYFRFFYDSTESFALCKTTDRWFQRHFQRNRTGFRDSYNYLPTAELGRQRITFVGDSFTIGHGIENVEERFANQIRALRHDYDVHVLAECGWNTGDELNLLKFLPQSGYETDVFVLVYCLNDISDLAPEWKKLLERTHHAPNPGFFVAHSYFLNTVYARLQMAKEAKIAGDFDFTRKAYDGSAWNQQQDRLKNCRETVAASDAKLLVVVFPYLHCLGDDYPYRDIHERLDRFWTELDVPHLDLLPLYSGEFSDQLMISSRDVHPNEQAHTMAAQQIAAFLDEHVR